MLPKEFKGSKAKKRKYEFLKRQAKKGLAESKAEATRNAKDIEELAAAMGVKLR